MLCVGRGIASKDCGKDAATQAYVLLLLYIQSTCNHTPISTASSNQVCSFGLSLCVLPNLNSVIGGAN